MSRILVVELDQNLVKTNLLVELSLKLLKKDPVKFIRGTFGQVIFGDTDLEHFLLENVDLNVESLPYNEWLRDYLLQQKKEGVKLILISEYYHKTVRAVADQLNIFDEVIAQEDTKTGSAGKKLDRLRNIVEINGDFDYIGYKKRNRAIWQNATNVYSPGEVDKFEKNSSIKTTGTRERQKKNVLFSVIRELRIHQWVKNILVFLPFILAHEWANPEKWISAVFAFFSFSLVASSVYVMNDMWDISADRQHPYKKNRPFAAGDLGILSGLVLIPISFFSGLSISWIYVSLEFTGILVLYWLLTTSYTFYLKRKVLLDVLILAGLYTIRLYGGAVATDVLISQWLMGFSLFFFLSLALIKRYTELTEEDLSSEQVSSSRGYIRDDLSLLMSVGVASGLMSVLIFALYINSPEITERYNNPTLLWFVTPVLLYWIIRVWKLANRGFMHDDPVVFAVKDKISVISGLIIITIVILSTYL